MAIQLKEDEDDENTSTALYIYFADRWNHNGEGSVGDASYIWLPMTRSSTDNNKFVLHGLKAYAEMHFSFTLLLKETS